MGDTLSIAAGSSPQGLAAPQGSALRSATQGGCVSMHPISERILRHHYHAARVAATA